MRKVRKAISVLRDQYQSSSMLQFISFLSRALFKHETIVIYSRSLSDIEAGDYLAKMTIVKGDMTDLESARGCLDLIPWELRCDVYDGVKDFFLYKEEGRVGHISWLYYKDDPNDVLRLADGECEIKFCLTFPEFRGKGLYPAALQAIQRYLKQHGYRRCFICVKDDNGSSVRGIEKAGFCRVGRVRLRQAFGVQLSLRQRTQDLQAAAQG